jgi:putative peptide maturation system protein
VLSYLMEITQDGTHPRDAKSQLTAVQETHPGMQLELIWEEESYDRSLHYDVLVRAEDGAVVSMSYCRHDSLPWPLRGVRRWSDANLLQVNGRMMTMEDAVLYLDVLWNEASIMERMVNACLIQEELEKRPVDISDEELQRGVDGLRRMHRLLTPEATYRWMQERGMTHAQLEQLVAGNLTCVKLRKRNAEGRVESYFEARRTGFDVAHIARLEVATEEGARRLRSQIADGSADLLAAAEQCFLETGEPCKAHLAMLRRRDAADGMGAALFAAVPGDVVGPFHIGDSYVIARLLALRPAHLDVSTREAIEEALFDEWLAERRRAAKVTWHWGKAQEAPAHGRNQ